MINMELPTLFSPKSIAVIGVSVDARKIGSTIFTNLLSGGYEGKLFPVNPNHQNLYGYKCYASLATIPNRVDMAVMAVPAANIMQILQDCAERKVKFLVIISAGFAEIGEKGRVLESELTTEATKLGIRILGPNCLGLLTSASKLNASFAQVMIEPGDIAFMSQSGAICTSMLDMADPLKIGFSHFVSLGNKVDIAETELLEYWLLSEKVKAIGGYLEEFESPLEFFKLREKTGVDKPIVLFTPGESKKGSAAAASHTGSLASEYSLISAVSRKYGISLVKDIDEALFTLASFAYNEKFFTNKVKRSGSVIITNAGGAGVVATDNLSTQGVELTDLSEDLINNLAESLPTNASLINPIDIIGDALVDRYRQTLEILISSQEIDSILVILTPQFVTQVEETAKLLLNTAAKTDKLIIPVFIGGKYVDTAIKRMWDNKLPAFSDISLAAQVLSQMLKYKDHLVSRRQNIDESSTNATLNPDNDLSIKKIFVNSTENYLPTAMPESDVLQLMSEYNLSIPKSALVRDWEEAQLAFASLTKPFVLKATSQDLVHKTEHDGVIMNIFEENQLKQELTRLQQSIYEITGKDHPPVLLQEQVDYELEIFMGIKYQSKFGYQLMIGQGGIYAEIYHDLVMTLLPVSESEISELLSQTKIGKILAGARNKNFPRKKIINQVLLLQELVLAHGGIFELDVNPLHVSSENVWFTDVKIFV